MTAARRFVFLVNEQSCHRARRLARDAGLALEGAHDVAVVRDVDEVRACLRNADPDVIPVAAGGDGTVNLVARALRAEGMTARAMGTIPAGTGNAFAHSLGVGRMRDAIKALVRGTPRALDVLVTDHPALPLALVSFSTGFEGHFLEFVARRRARGLPGYTSPRVLATLARPCRGATLRCDGTVLLRPEEGFYTAGVYNMPCYFFGRRVTRGADPTDGEAHARMYPAAGAYWRTVLGLSAGPPPSVRTLSFRRARLETVGPVQADGEAAEGGAFDIHVEPHGLNVLMGAG